MNKRLILNNYSISYLNATAYLICILYCIVLLFSIFIFVLIFKNKDKITEMKFK